MAASLQACGVVFPFAISTSICRSKFTICSGLYLFIGMTGLLQVNSLSFHLVQKSPVRSGLPTTGRAAVEDEFLRPGKVIRVELLGNRVELAEIGKQYALLGHGSH